MTKSVVSTLVGIAVEDGLLDPESTLAELLPDYADRMRPDVAQVKLRELLTMTGGVIEDLELSSDEVFAAPDVVAAALASGRGATGRFEYSTAGSHLVTAILVEATGGSVLDYAREVLFGPLEVDTETAFEPVLDPALISEYLTADFAWPIDPQGIHHGGSLLKLRPRDMLALGQLYLDGGRWQGDQLVPEEWVERATSTQVEVQGAIVPGYGYFWWVGDIADRDAFLAVGFGGQMIVVIPELELVAVVVAEFDLTDPSSYLTANATKAIVEGAVVAGYGRPS